MMRLPPFRYHAPPTLAAAADLLAGAGPEAMLLSGGTDLLPNMKRRQQVPRTLIALRQVKDLSRSFPGGQPRLGAGLTLTALVRNPRIRRQYGALWQAAVQIATPHLRNMGTLGGNLCLDTRCHYYDQSFDWRRAIGFCLKKDGGTCWVAPGSSICLAVSSTDTAPALMALGGRVRLVSRAGERELPLRDFYRNDGIRFLTRRPDEILTEVLLERPDGWRSTYWKVRRRGAFDFPVLSVAAAARFGKQGVVEEARVVLGAVAMQPLECREAAAALSGRALTQDAIQEAATLAARRAKPMDNTDLVLHWRKKMAHHLVAYALRELRGDDMIALRRRIARHDLIPV
ncbi:MAG: FAD binding domain-containing protein [Acidobacteriota bacterium]